MFETAAISICWTPADFFSKTVVSGRFFFFPILGPEGISGGGLQVLPQLARPATTSRNFLVQRASFSRSGSQPQLVQIKKMSAPICRFFAQLALVVFSVAIPEVSRGSVRGSLRLRHPVPDVREGRSV